MAEESGRDHAALFCDTNILVRFLTGDSPAQSPAARRVLEEASSGGPPIIVTDVVVAELCYVLTGTGRLSRDDVTERLAALISLPAIEVSDRLVLLDALGLWTSTRVNFADAYLAALTRSTEGGAVLSFDHDYDGIEGVERVDPRRY